jgi:uncharacterized protein
MRILVASDLHGRLSRIEELETWFKTLAPEKILLLGDYLYNGPRNGVPTDYDPMAVSQKLNLYKDLIIGVRGNCDSRIDDDLLAFPLEDNRRFTLGDYTFDLYHGDAFSLKNLHPEAGDLLLSGHTHIYVLKKENGFIYLNPGSISFPKNGNPPTFALIDGNFAQILALEGGEVLSTIALK